MDTTKTETEVEAGEQAGIAAGAEAEQAGQEVQKEGVTETAVKPLEEDAETLKKRLADTQAWGHRANQEAAALKRELDELRLRDIQAQVTPEVLETVERATQAVEIRKARAVEQAQQATMKAVYEAVPDVAALEGDTEFQTLLAKHAGEVRKLGKEPSTDPMAAIRAVTAARIEYLQTQARVAAEKADAARKTSKLSGMSVPGAGATGGKLEPKDWRDNPDVVKNMSDKDFAAMRAKALGF